MQSLEFPDGTYFFEQTTFRTAPKRYRKRPEDLPQVSKIQSRFTMKYSCTILPARFCQNFCYSAANSSFSEAKNLSLFTLKVLAEVTSQGAPVVFRGADVCTEVRIQHGRTVYHHPIPGYSFHRSITKHFYQESNCCGLLQHGCHVIRLLRARELSLAGIVMPNHFCISDSFLQRKSLANVM